MARLAPVVAGVLLASVVAGETAEGTMTVATYTMITTITTTIASGPGTIMTPTLPGLGLPASTPMAVPPSGRSRITSSTTGGLRILQTVSVSAPSLTLTKRSATAAI